MSRLTIIINKMIRPVVLSKILLSSFSSRLSHSKSAVTSLIFRCKSSSKSQLKLSAMAKALSRTDPNSHSNPDQCIVTDIYLNLNVNFKTQKLSGYVDLSVDRLDLRAPHVVLDAKDLTIHDVREKDNLSKMKYNLSPQTELFGSKLEIELPKNDDKVVNIRIDYETSPKASSLQWLTPEQTGGKIHPYVFSQCQAIHARTMLPCQDTPYVKTPYSATISAPSELTVLMSAIRNGEEVSSSDPSRKLSKFIQKVPIPVYLVALAVGPLESRKIGPRSHVWSEKEFVDKAAYEFAETEEMLKIGESLCGPYLWGIYDLLILPPSFAYGGMENPCITFLTPTLLCGDRSLTDVIAHEISHSWTGNLVTNKTFEHFWLNEGFTMFVERKICGRMQGEILRQFKAIIGLKDLEEDVKFLGEKNQITNLVPDLKGINPDDSYNLVPYEKGHTLLFYLEELLGGPEEFEKFLLAYLEEFQLKSLDTEEWKSFLYQHFRDKKAILDTVDWNAWLYSPGMPPVIPKYDTTYASLSIDLFKRWMEANENELSQFTAQDLKNMDSLQVVEFVTLFIAKAPLGHKKLDKMNELYKMSEKRNSEIRYRWSRLGLISHWEPIISHAIEFLTEQGRMRYVRPLYRDLYNWEEQRHLSVSTFNAQEKFLMLVAAEHVAKDLNICHS